MHTFIYIGTYKYAHTHGIQPYSNTKTQSLLFAYSHSLSDSQPWTNRKSYTIIYTTSAPTYAHTQMWKEYYINM